MTKTVTAREVLTAARKAFDAGELQMQTGSTPLDKGLCSYQGPCAIGAWMTPEQREAVEGRDYSCGVGSALYELGYEIEYNELSDLAQLQLAHDQAVKSTSRDYSWKVVAFERKLIELEGKYA